MGVEGERLFGFKFREKHLGGCRDNRLARFTVGVVRFKFHNKHHGEFREKRHGEFRTKHFGEYISRKSSQGYTFRDTHLRDFH